MSPHYFLKFDQIQPLKSLKSISIAYFSNFKILNGPLDQKHPDGLCGECAMQRKNLKEETVLFMIVMIVHIQNHDLFSVFQFIFHYF